MKQAIESLNNAADGVALALKDLCDIAYREQEKWEALEARRKEAEIKRSMAQSLLVIESKQLIVLATFPRNYYFDISDPRPTRPALESDPPSDVSHRVEIDELIANGLAVVAWNAVGVLFLEDELEPWIKQNPLDLPDWRLTPKWLRCRAVCNYGLLTALLPRAQF